jgi:hypothetical protein
VLDALSSVHVADVPARRPNFSAPARRIAGDDFSRSIIDGARKLVADLLAPINPGPAVAVEPNIPSLAKVVYFKEIGYWASSFYCKTSVAVDGFCADGWMSPTLAIASGGYRFAEMHAHLDAWADAVINLTMRPDGGKTVDPAGATLRGSTGLDSEMKESMSVMIQNDYRKIWSSLPAILSRAAVSAHERSKAFGSPPRLRIYAHCRSGRHRAVAFTELLLQELEASSYLPCDILGPDPVLALVHATLCNANRPSDPERKFQGALSASANLAWVINCEVKQKKILCPISGGFVIPPNPPATEQKSASRKRAERRQRNASQAVYESCPKTRSLLLYKGSARRVRVDPDKHARFALKGLLGSVAMCCREKNPYFTIAGTAEEQCLHLAYFIEEDNTSPADFEVARGFIRRVQDAYLINDAKIDDLMPLFSLRGDTAPGWKYREQGFTRTDECYSLIAEDTAAKLQELHDGELPEPGIQSSGGRGKKCMTQEKLSRKKATDPVGRFIRVVPKDDVLICEIIYQAWLNVSSELWSVKGAGGRMGCTAIGFTFLRGGTLELVTDLGMWNRQSVCWNTFAIIGPDAVRFDSSIKVGLSKIIFDEWRASFSQDSVEGISLDLLFEYVYLTHTHTVCRTSDGTLVEVATGVSSGNVCVQKVECDAMSAALLFLLESAKAKLERLGIQTVMAKNPVATLGDDGIAVLGLSVEGDLCGKPVASTVCDYVNENFESALLEAAETFRFTFHPLSGPLAKGELGQGAEDFFFLSRYLVSSSITGREIDESICSCFSPEKPTAHQGHFLLRLYGLLIDNPLSPVTCLLLRLQREVEGMLAQEMNCELHHLCDCIFEDYELSFSDDAKASFIFKLLGDVGFDAYSILEKLLPLSDEERLTWMLRLHIASKSNTLEAGTPVTRSEDALLGQGFVGLRLKSKVLSPSALREGLDDLVLLLRRAGWVWFATRLEAWVVLRFTSDESAVLV